MRCSIFLRSTGCGGAAGSDGKKENDAVAGSLFCCSCGAKMRSADRGQIYEVDRALHCIRTSRRSAHVWGHEVTGTAEANGSQPAALPVVDRIGSNGARCQEREQLYARRSVNRRRLARRSGRLQG